MRQGASALVAGLLLAGGTALAIKLAAPPPSPLLAERAKLALLTSLPLLFAESFSIEGGGSPALARLEQHYAVVPIAIADAASLSGHSLLLMAHPRAQTAEALVELDAWVRAGGSLVLLADPRLDWPSERPFGDPLRPPPDFADTGLLAHWGLTLAGPTIDGASARRANGKEMLFVSPGALTTSGACRIDAGGLIARCSIGRGAATVIADADFLNIAGPGAIDGPTGNNLDFLIAELRILGTR